MIIFDVKHLNTLAFNCLNVIYYSCSKSSVVAVTMTIEGGLCWDKSRSLNGGIARDACGTGGSVKVTIERFKGNLGLHERYLLGDI